MSTATATAPSLSARPLMRGLAFLASLPGFLRHAQRYEQLFEMSDAQLQARGLSRDALVRSYISGLGLN